MKEQNKLKVFIIKLLLKIFKRNETEREVSNEIKREMCRKAIQSGVCPRSCETCAWNVGGMND